MALVKYGTVPNGLTPNIVTGVSMAPWLLMGDAVLVDREISVDALRLGDVVVMRNVQNREGLIHRVVSLHPFRTKGDRNRFTDLVAADWKLEGRVVKRYRNGGWSHLRFRRVFWFLNVVGLYPGQRIPAWLSRTNIYRWIGGHGPAV